MIRSGAVTRCTVSDFQAWTTVHVRRSLLHGLLRWAAPTMVSRTRATRRGSHPSKHLARSTCNSVAHFMTSKL
eukprot:526456-Rhodomonas_salina.1